MNELSDHDKAAKWDALCALLLEQKRAWRAFADEQIAAERSGIKRPASDAPSYRRCRTITLSTGQVRSRDGVPLDGAAAHAWNRLEGRARHYEGPPACFTVEDFRKCAELLEAMP